MFELTLPVIVRCNVFDDVDAGRQSVLKDVLHKGLRVIRWGCAQDNRTIVLLRVGAHKRRRVPFLVLSYWGLYRLGIN